MRALLLGFAIAAIVLELALQIVAFVLWLTRDEGARPEGRVVLCIGDSMTYGFGAAPTEAYPPRLEAALQQRGAAWSVVNAGIPGQNSADVASRLPALLDQYRPHVLCLLVGVNDRWSRPKSIAAERLRADGFPLRWRTARLLGLALAWAGTPSANARDGVRLPFLGTWHVRGQAMQFAADGTARLGDVLATWRLVAGDIEITPAGGVPFLVRWRESERGIDFALYGWDRFHRARRGLTDGDSVPDEFDEALEVGALGDAQRVVSASRGAAAELAMQGQLCLALLRTGRRDEALALLHDLEAAWQQRRAPVAGEAIARWHAETGDRTAAIAVAEEVVALTNDRVACWRVLVDHVPPATRPELERRLEAAAAAQSSPWRRAELTAERSVLIATRDAGAAIEALLLARATGIGSDESVAALARAVALGADRGALLAAALRGNAPPAQRDALERDVRRAAVTDGEMIDVLGEHVRLAIELCRARGTHMLLLGYPFTMPSHEQAMQRITNAQQVPFVSMVAAFDARVATSARGEWFCDEIHCTARGYELMAELVADRFVTIWR